MPDPSSRCITSAVSNQFSPDLSKTQFTNSSASNTNPIQIPANQDRKQFFRRYSKPQGESECPNTTTGITFLPPISDSSVDGPTLSQFQATTSSNQYQQSSEDNLSVQQLTRHSSSPDLTRDVSKSSSSSIVPGYLSDSNTNNPTDPTPQPKQLSILKNMVGSSNTNQANSSALTASSSSPTLSKYFQLHMNQMNNTKSSTGAGSNSGGSNSGAGIGQQTIPTVCGGAMNIDSVDSSASDTFGSRFLSSTRQFGNWLLSTEGEKVEITKKDLNVFAPTTF